MTEYKLQLENFENVGHSSYGFCFQFETKNHSLQITKFSIGCDKFNSNEQAKYFQKCNYEILNPVTITLNSKFVLMVYQLSSYSGVKFMYNKLHYKNELVLFQNEHLCAHLGSSSV